LLKVNQRQDLERLFVRVRRNPTTTHDPGLERLRRLVLAKKGVRENGHSRLDEALTSLIQSQAALVQNQAAFLGRIAELEKVTAERFSRIEADFASILHVLGEHSRLLAGLPEAVRDKIGFKAQQ
jgi:hypothetical protein